MDEIVNIGGSQIASLTMDDEDTSQRKPRSASRRNESSRRLFISLSLIQKLIAELIGTYFLIFGGCAAVVVNANMDKVVTLPGIAMVWGLLVMVMIYCVGHISGAHFNPAVTIAFASSKKFPWKQVPAYVLIQVLGSTLASETLRLIFKGKQDQLLTLPAGSDMQSLVLEFVTTFYLMFVILAIATSDQAIKEVAGVAIGATVSIDILFAGPISGASMNPARSLGPAIISGHYEGLWIYMVGPISGAIAGAWVYEILRHTYKPLHDVTRMKRNMKASRSPSQQSVVRVTMDERDELMSCKCGKGWTCLVTKSVEPSKEGKAYYTCGGGTCSCLMLAGHTSIINLQETSMPDGITAFCKCDEGWSCVISNPTDQDSQESSEVSFECGGGCVCVINDTNTVKVVLRDRWISNGENVI